MAEDLTRQRFLGENRKISDTEPTDNTYRNSELDRLSALRGACFVIQYPLHLGNHFLVLIVDIRSSSLQPVFMSSIQLTQHDMVQLYAGARSKNQCYKMHRVIKDTFGMNKLRQLFPISKYCDYVGLDIEEVYDLLSGKHPMSNLTKK